MMEDFIMTILMNMTDGVSLVDLQSKRLIFTNPALLMMLGYRWDELKEFTIYDLVVSDKNQIDAHIQRVLEERRLDISEGVFRHKIGTFKRLEVHATPFWGIDALLLLVLVRERKDLSEPRQLGLQQPDEDEDKRDALTGFMTRHAFQQKIQDGLSATVQGTLLWLDITHFMDINKDRGFSVGDIILKMFAERLRQSVPGDILIARIADDEFALWSPYDRDALSVAHAVLNAVTRPYFVDNDVLTLTVSMGVVRYPEDGVNIEALFRHAVAALCQAKEVVGSTICSFDAQYHAGHMLRLTLRNQIPKALENHEFRLFYQPQIDIQTKTLVGMEALARWDKPGWGIIPPGQFIPVMEQSGLISAFGTWVMKTACVQNKMWQDAGLNPVKIAVNVSAQQFSDNTLMAAVEEALAISGLNPQWIELEITEGTAMQDIDHTRSLLRELKNVGINVVLDDFGTGFSSLAYLKNLPLDGLKIDLSFIQQLPDSATDAAIVIAILKMAKVLNLYVIAEGVETAEQLDFLRNEGCDVAQGYFVSPPKPAQDLEPLWENAARRTQVQ
ncbi:sensor domain-containing protein [Sulfobacillus thermosulfidooxidans]|uniref:sensor domain-containing protein n=1 Tax=Sulfobacillus thermosulfidooxidans TaxID=28034 RepID=UPI0006B4DE18|nr:bifunctional diguanylate cyclase/phosphodiesterase [Sulfobacillus thermosulfidooxidans]